MAKAADLTLQHLQQNMGAGVEMPPEFEELKKGRAGGAGTEALGRLVYNLMCEEAMLFDKDEFGVLTPTRFDLKNDCDDPEVKQKVSYVYRYGISMIQAGLIGMDDVKLAAKDRLIARVGKSPQEFDEWLGY